VAGFVNPANLCSRASTSPTVGYNKDYDRASHRCLLMVKPSSLSEEWIVMAATTPHISLQPQDLERQPSPDRLRDTLCALGLPPLGAALPGSW
jgi:hypothetical protein